MRPVAGNGRPSGRGAAQMRRVQGDAFSGWGFFRRCEDDGFGLPIGLSGEWPGRLGNSSRGARDPSGPGRFVFHHPDQYIVQYH